MSDRIPITEGERIAHKFGYDQVVIYARRVGLPGLEWVTTYGKSTEHCAAAARIGAVIGGQVVKPLEEARARAAIAEARAEAIRPGFQEAVADIVIERHRQIIGEGWTPKHDDEHGDGELARGAAAYAYAAALSDERRASVSGIFTIRNNRMLSELWPWALSWWKPKDRRRDLVRAGALIVAEIERLDRAEARARAAS